MNILDLLRQDGFDLKHKGATNGGEYAGPCPFCGGTDRLCCWPLKGGKGRGSYWCRQCGRHGDAVQYLRDARGMSYAAACAYLNLTPNQPGTMPRCDPYVWSPREAGLPCELWRKKAGEFLKEAVITLWSETGKESRRWVQECKGLQDDSVRAAMIGLNLKDTYRNRESWGLDPSMNERNGKPRKIWLPAGLVIPFINNDEVIRLRIRRFNAERGPRYFIVSGSEMRSLVLGPDKPVQCVVESELDAILLHQEAGNVAGIIAIGSANARPDKETDHVLRNSKTILLSLDFDIKNGKPTPAFNLQFWTDRYQNVKRWPCPIGKDPAEAFLAGVDLKAWLESATEGAALDHKTDLRAGAAAERGMK